MRTLSLLAALALLAACGRTARDLEVRRARLAAEQRDLVATLEHLEDRLLVNQARVRFWREMRDRHDGVTAVACASQEQHAEEMARHLAPLPTRAEARRARSVRARVASRPVTVPEPEPEPTPAVAVQAGAAN